ncbi:hypothetical protein CC78DRAFT_561618 [Lojkania enalia]|uniref:Uncharacterized protein n=1 Tax=Lojkania enalia TaxID=147567 RepID=A0A9P4K480_9PLEO|nr:hypothetical protein CC78DRAFT_561618 [Didymosphaeria enalia]
MTATTPTMAGLSVPLSNDAMELLSDSGYEQVQEDIHIDVDFNPDNINHHDDDLVLQDADTDDEEEVGVDSANIDDVMDGEGPLDLNGDISIQSTNHRSNVVTQNNFEEDLIDYSEDDETYQQEQQPNTHWSRLDAPIDAELTEDINSTVATADGRKHHLVNEAHKTSEPTPDEDAQSYEVQQDDLDGDDENAAQQLPEDGEFWDPDETDDNALAPYENVDDYDANGEHHSPIQAQEEVAYHEGNGNDHDHDHDHDYDYDYDYSQDFEANDHYDSAADEKQDETYFDESGHDDTNPQHDKDSNANADDEALHTPPIDNQGNKFEEPRHLSIKVNYDGEEIYLFPPSANEETHPFLLSDELVATQTFHHLFQACRTQLGDSIKAETELGLRMEDFEDLVFYEDSIACAHVCLNDVTDIYLALQEQDGDNNPPPLQMTFLFRPRVSAIINHLKKAVRDRLGFSSLKQQNRAGPANTSDNADHESDQEAEAWVDEEESKGRNSHATHDQGESYEQVNADDEYDLDNEHLGEGDTASYADNRAATELADSHGTEAYTRTTSNASKTADEPKTADTVSNSEQSVPTGAIEGEDLIDYSDDDENAEADAAQTGHDSIHGRSSGSSTVQGDHTSFEHIVRDSTNANKNDESLQPDYSYDGDDLDFDQDGEETNIEGDEPHLPEKNFEGLSSNPTEDVLPGPEDTTGGEVDFLTEFTFSEDTEHAGNYEIDYSDDDATTEQAVTTGGSAVRSTSRPGDLASSQALKRSIDEVDNGPDPGDQSGTSLSYFISNKIHDLC